MLDWTQERLADRAGVGLTTVRGFETGKSQPMNQNLAAIERAFRDAGVDLEMLAKAGPEDDG